MMFNLYRLRNEFWRVIALWACERAERSYAAFIERYDR